MSISHSNEHLSIIALVSVHIERYQFFGNLSEHEVQPKQTPAAKKIAIPYVPIIVAILLNNLKIPSFLSGNVRNPITDTSRYAYAIWKHHIMIQKSIHYTSTENGTKRSSL
ncbi:hypothetical protein D3C78_1167520 [compost metagenome]